MAELTVTDWVYTVAECTTGLLAILGNVLVLVAIYNTRSLRTVTNCFIGSLALADVLVGITVPPSTILPYYGLPRNFEGCVLLNSLVVLITNISILNLIAVALERYLAICHPFLYQRTMTIPRAMAVVSVTWVVAILLGLVPNMGWNLGKDNFGGFCAFTQVIGMDYMVYMIFFGVNIPPLVFMFCVYAYIFHIIRKLNKQVASQMATLSHDSRTNARRQKKEVRGAKSLAYVIILFAVCWMPIHVLNSITLFAPEKSPPYQVLLFTIVLSHANSFMNPIVYAFSNTQFKRAFVRILCCSKVQVSYTNESSGGNTTAAATTQFQSSKISEVNNSATDRPKLSNGLAQNFITQHVPVQNTHKASHQTVSNGVVNTAFDTDSDTDDIPRYGSPRSPDSKTVKWCDSYYSASGPDTKTNTQSELYLELGTNQNASEQQPENNESRLESAEGGGERPAAAVWATATSQIVLSSDGHNRQSSPQLSHAHPAVDHAVTTPLTALGDDSAVSGHYLGDNTDPEILLEDYVSSAAGTDGDGLVPGAPPRAPSYDQDLSRIPQNVSTLSLHSEDTLGDSDSATGSKQFVSVRL